MKDLKTIFPVTEDSFSSPSIDGRALHSWLRIKSRFNDWTKRCVESLNLTQDIDFVTILDNKYSPPRRDYNFTIDAAKMIGMSAKTSKGNEVRQYFLACEKELRNFHKNLSPAQQIVAMGNAMRVVELKQEEQQIEIDLHTKKIKRIEAEQAVLLGELEQYSVKTLAIIKNIRITSSQAKAVGKTASQISREEGREKGTVRDPVYGKIGAYDEDVLERAFEEVLKSSE